MRKRMTSLLLVLALCLTLPPTAAFAVEDGEEPDALAVEEPADPANGEAKQANQSAEQEEQQEDSTVKQAVADVPGADRRSA